MQNILRRFYRLLPLASLIVILALSTACGSTHTTHETSLHPDTSGLSGMKGSDMPPNTSIPMPDGWKGFKAY